MGFTIPGTLGPNIEARRTMLGGAKVYADGVEVKRSGWFRPTYRVRASDGKEHELRLKGALTSLKAEVGTTQIPLERPLRGWELVLTLLPIGLALLGGWLGLIFGAVASTVNHRVARSELRAPSKVVAMIGVPLVAVALYLGTVVGVGLAMAPVPEYEAGKCLDGLYGAGNLSSEAIEIVPCSQPHDGEVVGNVEHPDGSYPGEEGLLAFGSSACRAPFAEYVGVSFDDSHLDMILLWPEQILWLKGDRTIDCVALDPGQVRLTGSIRDSRQ